MRDHLKAFVHHLSDRRSASTTKTYGSVLSLFVRTCATPSTDASPPTRAEIEAFLARPRRDGGRRSAAGRNQELAALRAFAKFALRDLGWIENPTDGVPFVREAPRDPPVLSVFELRRLFTTAAEGVRPGERSRDLAILAVLGQAGLRVHEVVGLDVGQIDLASATIVAVRGKGGTIHDLPLNAPTIALLTIWLGERAEIVSADEPALFVSSRRTRLSVRSVQHLLVRLREAMGTAKKITPHTLRHTTATLALTLGADLSTVADLLRHTDLNTTRRYLHLVDERRREAVRRLGTAIPAELLHDSAGPAGTAGVAEKSGASGLDVQHGLDDATDARRAA
jgi:site-specific recombinase XerD